MAIKNSYFSKFTDYDNFLFNNLFTILFGIDLKESLEEKTPKNKKGGFP